MKTYLRKLDAAELRHLTTLRDPKLLDDDAPIFCLGEVTKEVPILVEGQITILKDNEDCLLVTPGYALGLTQLLSNQPCALRCRPRNAKVILARSADFDETDDRSFYKVLGKWFSPRG